MIGTVPAVLLYSLWLGAGLGFLFLVFEVLRLVLTFGKCMTALWDILFCLLAAAGTFLLALAAASGRLRFYQAGCEILGFWTVHTALTGPVSRGLKKQIRRRKRAPAGKTVRKEQKAR